MICVLFVFMYRVLTIRGSRNGILFLQWQFVMLLSSGSICAFAIIIYCIIHDYYTLYHP